MTRCEEDEMVMESIRTIMSIAETFDCEPTEIDRSTGADTLEVPCQENAVSHDLNLKSS